MNNLEITAIQISTSIDSKESAIENIFKFCNVLNRILGNLKICHLFTDNYNAHQIYGNLYDSLSINFDKLAEELIGLVKIDPRLDFPLCDPILNDPTFENSDYYQLFQISVNSLYSVLTLNTFLTFVENAPKNGIKNVLEEIYNSINKAGYLLTMAIKTLPEPVSNSSEPVTQTGISTGYPTQTYEIQPVL